MKLLQGPGANHREHHPPSPKPNRHQKHSPQEQKVVQMIFYKEKKNIKREAQRYCILEMSKGLFALCVVRNVVTRVAVSNCNLLGVKAIYASDPRL